MRWLKTIITVAATVALSACAARSPLATIGRGANPPVTILIGIDGFRPDYLDRGVTPELSRLARLGVRGAMRPSFPVKTFPNFVTLATGLRPDRHGIVANKFEDPARPGESFTQASREPHWWAQAEPIWITAERAGIPSAILFWPGGNIAFHGVRPRDWQQFNMDVSDRQRVDAVVDWLRRPAETRPHFIALYFDTIDSAGHDHGPEAPELLTALQDVDAQIGRLTTALAAMRQPANVVVVGDHGMGAPSPARQIRLDRIVDAADIRLIESGPYAAIEPLPGREGAVAQALLQPHDHMQCWRRAEVPARFHYGRNPRTPSFLCLAQTGWMIAVKPPAPDASRGEHGWDPAAPEMQAGFLASGPSIAAKGTIPPFDNVDVYPMLRRLLGLPPAHDIDGRDATLQPILR